MKKILLFAMTIAASALCANAEETIVTVWEGSQAGNLLFKTGSANYNNLVGDGAGQANLADGDEIRIYYTGAGSENKIWLQNNDWSSYSNDITGVTTDVLTAGDGVYTVPVSAAFADAIKSTGLIMQRSGDYTFTKVEVVKPDAGVIVPGADETIVWSGSATGNSSVDFRYEPNKSKLLNAGLEPGKYIKVYMSDVEAGDQIYIKECKDWTCLNTQTTMSAGTQVFAMELTSEIVDKIQNDGMIIQREGNGTTYDFEIRYVTVAPAEGDDPTTGIGQVEAAGEPGDAPAYDVWGRRVSPKAKGLVIINGKKIYNR